MRAVAGVREVALVKLDGPHGPYLGAVVVPDLWGRSPRDLHKRTLALELRRKLLPVFPKGTVPKKYRFVRELPRNAQGKVLASELGRIFDMQFAEPFVLSERRDETGWSADMVFDPDAAYFQGHFPGFPVLAGVVQLGIAHRFAEQLTRRKITLKTVKKMKFTGIVQPSEVVCLTLSIRGEHEISYTYRKGEAVCASGVMEY